MDPHGHRNPKNSVKSEVCLEHQCQPVPTSANQHLQHQVTGPPLMFTFPPGATLKDSMDIAASFMGPRGVSISTSEIKGPMMGASGSRVPWAASHEHHLGVQFQSTTWISYDILYNHI